MLKQLNHILTGADIAWQARIGTHLVLFHPTGTVIGPGVVIGIGCQIQQGVTIGNSGRKIHADDDWPVLGDNVYLGAGSRVIGSLTIGNNVAVGANAVVLHDIAENSSAVGVPAVQRRKSF
ncbi:serine O-acetyltransferase [Arthrobacter bambusae]|uniref:serine O-acetyltransferase n=1 Tax=Arthrobacter bambusae TaxID=1338426 RepID=UPI003521194A